MFNRPVRTWADVHSVRIHGYLTAKNPGKRKASGFPFLEFLHRLFAYSNPGLFIDLFFKSGGVLSLPLEGFSEQGLEDFFLALSKWADPMSLNPDVIALQKSVLSRAPLELSPSYTALWEASLQQSVQLTNFVPLQGGQQLADGRYKILMMIECGGFSSVYLACDPYGKRVVIKELSVTSIEGTDSLTKVHDMFKREAQILAGVDHPSIVKVLDWFVENGRNYLVLGLAVGHTLRQHVQLQGQLKESAVYSIAKQLAEILAYLHGFDPPIIHRDITPDNLILNEAGKITLIDFGAATHYVSTLTGTLVGKQCYVSPEQFRGHAEPASDIYSTGAVLHYLCTGVDPEPISQSHPRLLNPGIPEGLDSLIAEMTATDAGQRISSAGVLLEQLESGSSASG